MSELHARDLTGYGRHLPDPQWPGNARLAVNFVINYEEGAESAIPNGDEFSETYLTEMVALAQPPAGARVLAFESIYEYGSRAGAWRLLDLFSERDIKGTIYAVGQAAEKNPEAIKAFYDANFEIASHHYRWIDYSSLTEEQEVEHLQKAVSAIRSITGKEPVGLYGGRTSMNTRRLCAESSNFLYESDAYNDDLPYWVEVDGKPLLIIPYSLDNNDFRYATLPGWSSGDDFFNYNKATFDQLYKEGAKQPKMMSVGLHCRLSGRPGRAEALGRFLDYVRQFDDVWICTREEIARHWHEVHPHTATGNP